MITKNVSIRLPSHIVEQIRSAGDRVNLSISGALESLLEKSFAGADLLANRGDCPRPWDEKLDFRLPQPIFDGLRNACARLQISPSEYVRRLLYHYYDVQTIDFVEENGRYTLAELT
jgi:hypothetical protein